MRQETLMDMPPVDESRAETAETAKPQELGGGRPRLRCANRQQMEFRPLCPDELLPDDHMARLVWEYVESLDLTPFYQQIRAVEGHEGHPPADPKILVSLWFFATLEGLGSARRLAKLCERDLAYMWI